MMNEKIVIDLQKNLVTLIEEKSTSTYDVKTREAFSIISEAWLRCGWDNKYVYSFTWMGRPIIQLPEDMIRIQEIIYKVRPDVIIETGVAHGGSLVFYASLMKSMGYQGRVIGIDIEIRPHNRKAIECHELFEYITLVEGSSIDKSVMNNVKSTVKSGEKVLVMLDSNHTKKHVLAELNGYADLVSLGSYLVAADGIMGNLTGAPRSNDDWSWNNPKMAAEEFVRTHDNFIIEEPVFLFNESTITERVTYWPSAFLKRIE
jgi:cephalosporin hydroxylase